MVSHGRLRTGCLSKKVLEKDEIMPPTIFEDRVTDGHDDGLQLGGLERATDMCSPLVVH